MAGYADIANSPVLWVLTLLAIGLVLFQTYYIWRRSMRAGEMLGIHKDTLHSAFRTGLISSFGPSVVIVLGMVPLILIVGAPTALMRLTFLGSVSYELLSAELAAEASGVSLRDPALPAEVFSITLWCMAAGCVMCLAFVGVVTDKMEKFTKKLSGKSAAKFSAVAMGAMLGAYGYLNAAYAVSMDRSTAAMLGGAIVMFILTRMYKKTKKRWINEWSLTIAMVFGVVIAALMKR